jgi:hypothetical protein
MSTVPTYVVEERLPQLNLPLLPHAVRLPHNYADAYRLFQLMVRADAMTDGIYEAWRGDQLPAEQRPRLVLTQAGGVWRSAPRCRHCGEAIWQDGVNPGRGIWMHRQQIPENGWFRGLCEGRPGTHAEPPLDDQRGPCTCELCQLYRERPDGAR